MIKGVIFDMDGLLIDSEPLWQKAEIEIFGKLGLSITVDDCKPVQGMKLSEVVQYWYNVKPWEGVSFAQVEKEIMDYMKFLVASEGKIMDGVLSVLDFFWQKGIPMAVASSSNMDLIELVVNKLEIGSYFEFLHSSQFEKKGKPEPDIFLTAAVKLGVEPGNTLVFEDSVNGVIAGLRAGMKVVAVPYPENFHYPEFDSAHLKLKSLNEWDESKFEYLSLL